MSKAFHTNRSHALVPLPKPPKSGKRQPTQPPQRPVRRERAPLIIARHYAPDDAAIERAIAVIFAWGDRTQEQQAVEQARQPDDHAAQES